MTTLLELAVLGDDRDAADENLAEAASHARHAWEIQSTKRNLGMIRAVRETRNEDGTWIKQIEDELDRAAEALKPAG